MDSPGPGGGGSSLEQLLGDLLQLMGGANPGAGRIELARTLAQGAATNGEAEGNVDPGHRILFEEMARIAEMHVAELTGLSVTPTGVPVEIVAVGPGAWAWRTVDDWRFLFEAETAVPPAGSSAPSDAEGPRTGDAAGAPPAGDAATTAGLGLVDLGDEDLDLDVPGAAASPMDLVSRWMATMGPILTGLQLGSAIGHLARSTFGQYELPVPRPTSTSLLVVPANVDAFARDWSLPGDEVRLWVCLRDMTINAVLSRPHVADRIRKLLTEVVVGMAGDTDGLADRLQGLDPSDPDSLQRLFGDPEAFLGGEADPQRQRVSGELTAVTTALLGYVEHVLDRAGARLLGGRTALAEAWRRRQVDRETADRTAELLLGLDLSPVQVDRGNAFVRGVLERAGEEGLAQLWSESHTLPTPAEVDAPGLWLERISLG
ncbi:MAG TPA: zinc-dependent metalloprotease [Acidimicrobiales bacterium]|nr:zinc-dependent metalloprotease [Acidimicrobiales bacterium]